MSTRSHYIPTTKIWYVRQLYLFLSYNNSIINQPVGEYAGDDVGS